jgi:hypothetical protein
VIATIRHAIRAVVDFAHNVYAQLPAAAQTFLMLAVFGLFAAAQGFNWTIPTTGAQFHLELAALAALAYAVVVPLFQTYILPNLLTWLIALLQIIPEVSVAPMTTPLETLGRKPRRTMIWRAA